MPTRKSRTKQSPNDEDVERERRGGRLVPCHGGARRAGSDHACVGGEERRTRRRRNGAYWLPRPVPVACAAGLDDPRDRAPTNYNTSQSPTPTRKSEGGKARGTAGTGKAARSRAGRRGACLVVLLLAPLPWLFLTLCSRARLFVSGTQSLLLPSQ